MADGIKRLTTYLRSNWERLLFGLVGGALLLLSFRHLLSGKVAGGSALFAMSVFSFFYSNLARFKKFKGLGFEAELWEDKQKEAADLIERLKSIVSVYTREIVMNNVMRGRWGDGEKWEQRWAVYEELTGKHAELGQQIDFASLKRDVDRVFIFDICSPLAGSIRTAIEKTRAEASRQIQNKYGSPITDLEGWNADHEKLREIHSHIDDIFVKAESQNIAEIILALADDAKTKLEGSFGLTPEFDQNVLDRLQKMVGLIKQRPIIVTPQLIEWAHWREDRH